MNDQATSVGNLGRSYPENEQGIMFNHLPMSHTEDAPFDSQPSPTAAATNQPPPANQHLPLNQHVPQTAANRVWQYPPNYYPFPHLLAYPAMYPFAPV